MSEMPELRVGDKVGLKGTPDCAFAEGACMRNGCVLGTLGPYEILGCYAGAAAGSRAYVIKDNEPRATIAFVAEAELHDHATTVIRRGEQIYPKVEPDTRICSGPNSEDLWDAINVFSSTCLEYKALYAIGCAMQELESHITAKDKEPK